MLSCLRSFLVAIFCLAILCSSQAFAQTSSWNYSNDSQKRAKILTEARKDVGKQLLDPYGPYPPYLQCKEWVRRIIQRAGGPTVPPTFTGYGTHYLAKWYDGANTSIRWQAWYGNTFIINFTQLGLQPGHVIQWRNIFTGREHTTIIESVSPTSLTLLDCNWDLKGGVARRTITAQYWLQNLTAWTVYQIN